MCVVVVVCCVDPVSRGLPVTVLAFVLAQDRCDPSTCSVKESQFAQGTLSMETCSEEIISRLHGNYGTPSSSTALSNRSTECTHIQGEQDHRHGTDP